MTTQTPLSAAAPAPQEEPRLQWHRHSCLCAVAKTRTQPTEAAASLRFKFLIANDNPTRIVILSDQRESKDLPSRSRSLKLFSPRFLIANLELEFLATRTKRGLLRFSNRKKIAVFDPRRRGRFVESQELSSPLACPNDRSRRRKASNQHISNRNSRFTEFRSTYCKHAPYQISNRNKNAHFALSCPRIASHVLRVTSHDPRITTRAAFRSTIPARPHGYR